MGKDTNEYKNLRLKLEEIPGIINSWGIGSSYSNVSVVEPQNMTAQALNYTVNCDDKIATLAIFPAKGGVYTISPKVGKEQTISKEIADFIVSRSGNLADSNPYKNGLSINISKADFDAFYDLIKELEDVVVDEERTESHKFFSRLRNKVYKDSIVISYYSTGKMVIQGKPLELFALAIELLGDNQGLLNVVNAETKSAGLTISGNDVIEDMKVALGNAYAFLGDSHKIILSTAFVFYRTNIALVENNIPMDYSVLFHPASRVLEGYILKLLVNNNVLHDNAEMLGYYFRSEDDNNPLTLHEQYVAQIDNDGIVYEINKLYKLFHRVRHAYSHAAENDYSTALITERNLADKHFKEIIEAINKSYEVIVSAKK